MTKLTVIDGSTAPETPAETIKKIRSAGKTYMVQCHRCKGMEVIEVKLGVRYNTRQAKYQGGQKQLLCAHCFMKGERVVVM